MSKIGKHEKIGWIKNIRALLAKHMRRDRTMIDTMIGRQMMIRKLHKIIEKAAYSGKGKIKKLY